MILIILILGLNVEVVESFSVLEAANNSQVPTSGIGFCFLSLLHDAAMADIKKSAIFNFIIYSYL